MQPYLMARFPSRSAAELFVELQAAYINVGIITDSQQLHPNVKDALPVQVNYQLKKPENSTKLVTDAYGNMIPSTLTE